MDAQDRRLRGLWSDLLEAGSASEEFSRFGTFRAWAYANGYNPDTEPVLIDPDGPFCRENCTFAEREKTDTSLLRRNIAGWDRMVDGIRAGRSMPPIISSSPCPGCPEAERCEAEDTVCETRLRYWDCAMGKIRENTGKGGPGNGK